MRNDDVLAEVGVSELGTSRPTQSTRGRKQDAMVFLQGVLATGPAAVTEIEARARAAGLLGDRQDISHAKRFKHAKAALGIASIRQGFGRDAPANSLYNFLPLGKWQPCRSCVGASAHRGEHDHGN